MYFMQAPLTFITSLQNHVKMLTWMKCLKNRKKFSRNTMADSWNREATTLESSTPWEVHRVPEPDKTEFKSQLCHKLRHYFLFNFSVLHIFHNQDYYCHQTWSLL